MSRPLTHLYLKMWLSCPATLVSGASLQSQSMRVQHLSMLQVSFMFCFSLTLEKEMATHSSTLAWKIPWTEEPGRLQSHGVAKSWTRVSNFTFFHFHLHTLHPILHLACFLFCNLHLEDRVLLVHIQLLFFFLMIPFIGVP